MTDSKVYIVIQHDDKYHSYNSTEELNWPPPEKEIVSMLVHSQIITQDARGYAAISATDVLLIFTDRPMNLIKVNSA